MPTRTPATGTDRQLGQAAATPPPAPSLPGVRAGHIHAGHLHPGGGHPGWCGGASSTGSPWLLSYDGFDPAQEGTREALCTLGNGYWGTRGAATETAAEPTVAPVTTGTAAGGTAAGDAAASEVHYPGTYLAGIYNRVPTDLGDRTVQTEHLVNAPNWIPVQVRIGDAPWLDEHTAELITHHQQLDLRRGVLTRTVRYRDTAGRTTAITTTRLVSQAAVHLAAQQTVVEAEDWTGTLTVRAALDARVRNRNVVDDRQLTGRHLVPVAQRAVDAETVLLEVATSSSQVHIAMAARTRAHPRDGASGGVDPDARRVVAEPGLIAHEFDLPTAPGRPVSVEKVVAVATSRDRAQYTPDLGARAHLARAPDFPGLLAAHERAWEPCHRRTQSPLLDRALPADASTTSLLRQTTAPFAFTATPTDLAGEFSAATLTILKGDLNYRRVFGDRHWPATTTTAALAARYFPVGSPYCGPSNRTLWSVFLIPDSPSWRPTVPGGGREVPTRWCRWSFSEAVGSGGSGQQRRGQCSREQERSHRYLVVPRPGGRSP